MVEDPAAACPQAQGIRIHSDAYAVAKLLRLAFPPSRRAKAPLRRDGGRHSRAPFVDSTAGLDRTHETFDQRNVPDNTCRYYWVAKGQVVLNTSSS